MQGTEGSFKLMSFWFLSLDGSSPAIKAIQRALSVLTGGSIKEIPTVDSLFSKLTSVFSKAMEAYRAVKDFLYVNFRVGADSRYPRTVDNSLQTGHIEFDSEEIFLAASRLKKAAENLTSIKNRFDAECNIHANEEFLMIDSIVGIWDFKRMGDRKLQKCIQQLDAMSKALDNIGSKLEETENSIKRYANM